jgi:hypothetical protein
MRGGLITYAGCDASCDVCCEATGAGLVEPAQEVFFEVLRQVIDFLREILLQVNHTKKRLPIVARVARPLGKRSRHEDHSKG